MVQSHRESTSSVSNARSQVGTHSLSPCSLSLSVKHGNTCCDDRDPIKGLFSLPQEISALEQVSMDQEDHEEENHGNDSIDTIQHKLYRTLTDGQTFIKRKFKRLQKGNELNNEFSSAGRDLTALFFFCALNEGVVDSEDGESRGSSCSDAIVVPPRRKIRKVGQRPSST